MEKEHRCTIAYDNTTGTSGSFLFEGETHTMGNALRQTIVSNPEVDFCAYSVPHPAEAKMRLRIQCNESTNIIKAIDQGLDKFSEWCQNVENEFDNAIAPYL